MARKRHAPERMIGRLRPAEVEITKGQSAQRACRKIAATE